MSGEEGTAEKVCEAGMELINPGGSPGDLRMAAKGWRLLHENLDGMITDMDREVQRVLGEGWRGEAADAFSRHWNGLTKGIKETLPQLEEAAKSLDKAADSIEQINEEIHQIYLEIGISVGVSVGLSFLTMGFSAAAGAARATQLAAKAAQLAGRLGTTLRKVAQAFRTVAQLASKHKFLKNVLINWASNTGSTVAAKGLTGQDVDLWEATWQGGVSAVAGTGPGMATANRLGGLKGEVLGGGVGSATGGMATDGVSALKGDDVNPGSVVQNAAFNFIGGAAGGAAVHGLGNARAGAAESDFATTDSSTGQHFGLPRPSRSDPHLSVEGVGQGMSYIPASAGNEVLKDFQEGNESNADPAPSNRKKLKMISDEQILGITFVADFLGSAGGSFPDGRSPQRRKVPPLGPVAVPGGRCCGSRHVVAAGKEATVGG